MSITIINKDLFEVLADVNGEVIVHGCNCFHTMKAGIAKAIADRYPDAVSADKLTKKGDRTKLGSISVAFCDDAVLKRNIAVINAYTQYEYGRGTIVYANYEAIEEALVTIRNGFDGKKILMPKIGCGLANGDWNIVYELIKKVFEGSTCEIFVCFV